MEHINKLLTFIFITSLQLQAQALINPHQGSLELDFTSDLKFKLPFALHYSSRSLYEGSFGRGWCSSMDYRITRVDKGLLEIRHCEKEITVSATDLKKQENLLLWKSPEGFFLGFLAKTGELKSIQNTGTQKWEPIEVYNEMAQVTDGLLRSLQTKEKKFYFTYDTFDNLELITLLDKPLARFQYDNNLDLLTSASFSDGCDLTLSYKLLKPIDVETKVVKTCNKIKYFDTYLFKHQRFATGEIYLAENIRTSRKEPL